ncbi:Uncharacterised protein [Mycobacteroides abscessus subsp. massiliense]|nr:Uncharacterised protein [Mycobacteroides abscessus subsp. massiliense]
MMSEYPEVIVRTALSFSILFIGARILGKQTISQMTLFDFIAAISLGAITANLSFSLIQSCRFIIMSLPTLFSWQSFTLSHIFL